VESRAVPIPNGRVTGQREVVIKDAYYAPQGVMGNHPKAVLLRTITDDAQMLSDKVVFSFLLVRR